MLRSLYLAIFVLVLAGCGADHPPAADAAGTSAPAAAQSPSRRARAPQAGIDSALQAISKKLPSHVRYDKVVPVKTGGNQRQVFVEMLGASSEQAEAATTSALKAAGFTAQRGKADADGVRIQYRKTGVKPINVLIRSKAAGPALQAPEATSSIYFRQDVV